MGPGAGYRLPATTSSVSSSLANVFALLEAAPAAALGIQDYQLGQTTLEEVFLKFAEEGGAGEDK